jgi:hypothetical protein
MNRLDTSFGITLSANQMNAPGFAGAFLFAADGRACLNMELDKY